MVRIFWRWNSRSAPLWPLTRISVTTPTASSRCYPPSARCASSRSPALPTGTSPKTSWMAPTSPTPSAPPQPRRPPRPSSTPKPTTRLRTWGSNPLRRYRFSRGVPRRQQAEWGTSRVASTAYGNTQCLGECCTSTLAASE